jgi:methyl-accepting chemotaxis protein
VLLGKLRVGQRISLITILVTLSLLVLLIVSFNFFAALEDRLTDVRDRSVPNAIIAKDMQMQVVQVQQWLTDISATRGMDGLDDGFDEAEKAYQAFQADLAKIRASYAASQDQEGLRMADTLKARIVVWYETGKRMANAYVAGGPEGGNPIMGEFDKVSSELQAALEPVIAGQVDEAKRELVASMAAANRVRLWLLAGIALVIAIAVFGGIWLTRSVVKRLEHISDLMRQMVRSKDLSVEVETDGEDEIAMVGGSFRDLVATLRALMQSMTAGVAQLDQTAGMLASAVTRAASSSEASSESVSSMAAAAEQMSANLNQMRDSSQATLAVVHDASRYSDEGGQVIDSAVVEMQKIAQSVLQVSSSISQLGEQTGRISNIVEVIREVAEQTNLLALNAAIEAARAGEAGRGFAVVADEVRKLAERTSQSTEEIGTMIQAIQHSARSAVGTMDEAVGLANSGAGLAESAGKAIANIRRSTGDVEKVFSDITLAIAEQSSAGQVIASKVEAVAQATEESRLAAQQSAQAAQALGAMSDDMRGLVAGFSA